MRGFLEEKNRVTLKEMADELNLTTKAIHKILHRDLGFSKKPARWVPRLLTEDQKQVRVDWCKKFLEMFSNGHSAEFKLLTTGDETWIYNLDPETKSQSMVWSKKGAQPPLKARRIRSCERCWQSSSTRMELWLQFPWRRNKL